MIFTSVTKEWKEEKITDWNDIPVIAPEMAGFSTDETVGRVVLNAPLPPEWEYVWGAKANPYNVRNLAYLALVENRQNFLNEKLDM